MHRRSTLVLAGLLAWNMAAAREPTPVEVDDVTMTFELPEGWEPKVFDDDPAPRLVNEDLKADIWPTPTPPGDLDKYEIPGLPPDEGMKMTLRFGFGPMIRQATSKDPEVLPMPGADPPGYYVAFPAPGGNGRHAIVGVIYQAGVEVVLMGSAATKSQVADVVAIMATIRVVSSQ